MTEATLKESWENFREWVAMALNVFLAPDGLIATDETINTFAQILECRAKELALLQPPCGGGENHPQRCECCDGCASKKGSRR